MARWLITGANGFLGSNAGRMLSEEHETIGLVRSGTAVCAHQTINADLTDEMSIRKALRIAKPKIILHAAALSSHESCRDNLELAKAVNVESTRIIAQEAQEIDARLLYVSTDAVFDGRLGNYSESDTPSPFSDYGQTKLMGEIATSESCRNHLIVRTNFFGWSPSGQRSILEFFDAKFRAGEEAIGWTDFSVTSLYVEQLVNTIIELERLCVTGTVHVASNDALTKYEFGKLVLNADHFPRGAKLHRGLSSSGTVNRSRRDLSLNVGSLRDLGIETFSQASGVIEAYRRKSVKNAGL